MNKNLLFFGTFALSGLLVSCASKPTPPPIARGYLNFDPPKGDPSTERDWRKYGPGSIIRHPAQSLYINASEVIGDEGVKANAVSTSWTPIQLKRGSEERKVLVDAAAQYTYQTLVSSGLSAESVKELKFSYEFGNAYEAQIGEGSLLKTLSTQKAVIDKPLAYLLKKNQAHVIQGVLIVESMTVTAKDSKDRKIDFNVKLTEDQKASLKSESTSVTESELTFSVPRFAAYLPLLPASLRENKIIR